MTNDDKLIKSYEMLEGRECIATEKMDGENTTIGTDYSHARSIDSRNHVSREWIKRFQSEIGYKIPVGWRVCGENLYAKHSLGYSNLLSYFYGFSIWDDRNVALGWDETLQWFEELGITPVREMYRGTFSIEKMIELAKSVDTNVQEGFVVRVTDEVPYDLYNLLVAKWVRSCHVTTEQHWMHMAMSVNGLAK
jgi:hypothetical protein